ncbi:hypothetical protein [Halochromatium roseum]|uniref:hypothetical protein n=1 Tax=Halochromatium roseum TaxID=391920 RepID=UPI0019137E88|nr:hypothetical protein [Halochromatium roseum]MBK5938341.1 hypothetical protein [Halochromatium roseum]
MKINFTKKEYQLLVEMILAADWIIRGYDDVPCAATKSYDDLRKKLLSHHQEMGMEDAFVYDPDQDDYFETRVYEDRAAHLRFIDLYDERTFWSLLTNKLAARDLAAEQAQADTSGALTEEQRSLRFFERLAGYEELFAERGLEALRIAPKTAGCH